MWHRPASHTTERSTNDTGRWSRLITANNVTLITNYWVIGIINGELTSFSWDDPSATRNDVYRTPHGEIGNRDFGQSLSFASERNTMYVCVYNLKRHGGMSRANEWGGPCALATLLHDAVTDVTVVAFIFFNLYLFFTPPNAEAPFPVARIPHTLRSPKLRFSSSPSFTTFFHCQHTFRVQQT